MQQAEWSIPAVIDVVTDVAPDRTMLVCGARRQTYRETAVRTRQLAAFLVQAGLGVRQERAELARWEIGQDRLAVLLSNCPEYAEALIGAFRARVVPYNVNYQYKPREV